MKVVNVNDAVTLKNKRVEPFSGQRPYLTTGGLGAEGIRKLEYVTYDKRPSRADLLVEVDNLVVARMKETKKVMIINNENKDLIVSTGYLVLEPKPGVLPRYLYHFLRSSYFQKQKDRLCVGATQKAINNSAFGKIDIHLLNFSHQKRIAAILDKADAMRQKRKQSLKLLDEFLRSVFLDMFGDLWLNTKKWPKCALSEAAEVVSGVTKGRQFNQTKTVEVPYMRVANVQDGYIDIDDLKHIEVLPSDVEKYSLQHGDILLTEGGDPDKLGRGAVWKYEIEHCIHQNHIFRVRPDLDVLHFDYLNAVIGSTYGKRYFLRSAKQTTGIASINSTQLKAFPVPLPPLKHQECYAEAVEKVGRIADRMIVSQIELDRQFNSTVQRAFRGEL